MNDEAIFTNNKEVYNSLTEYNNAYKNYKKCLDSGHNCDDESLSLSKKYTKITDNISTLIDKLNSREPSKNKDIKKSIDDNNKLRNELELKLQKIYEYKNPELSEFNLELNRFNTGMNESNLSLYSGIVWTILMTSSLYIILVKL